MNAFYPTGSSQETIRDESGHYDSGLRGVWGKGFYLCSVFVHLALVGVLFFFQGVHQQRIIPTVIQMDLASTDLSRDLSGNPENLADPVQEETEMSPEPQADEASDKERIITFASEPEPAEKSENKVVPVKERVATKPAQVTQPLPEPLREAIEPGRKISLKKKTFQADKVLESARSSMEKKVEKQVNQPDPPTGKILDKALARLEKAVETQSGSRAGASSDSTPNSSFGPGVSGNGVKGSKTDYTAIDLYNLELMYRIQQNWAFNPRLARSEKGIEARVLIKILKNGQIRDVWFETRSGNSYLDDSALKAVKKSNPLPPLPKGYATYDIGLKFTPSGLK